MAATNKFNMSASEMVRRWIVFCAALFVMAFGVAVAIRANLGTSPISSLPYVLSQIGGLTIW